jgi:ribose 5-phosphate isomerase A
MEGNQLFITDNNNYILDCQFGRIDNPEKLAADMNRIPGVVENGLFVQMARLLITNNDNGGIIILQ